MKIVKLAIGTCVTDKETLTKNIPSNDGNLERALLKRLDEMSDDGEAIPKGYEDKKKEPKPRKRASSDISTVMFLEKNPLNGMLIMKDSSGGVLSRYDGTDEEGDKRKAAEFCKSMGYTLWDHTNQQHQLGKKQPVATPPIRLAVKRHKTRPKSYVGKLEGAYTAPGGSGKIDTRLTPVHRYVLEMDFSILLKQSNSEIPNHLTGSSEEALQLMERDLGIIQTAALRPTNVPNQSSQNVTYESKGTHDFWKRYFSLPPKGKQAVYDAYTKWTADAHLPGLGFRHLDHNKNVWRINCGDHWRAAARKVPSGFEWFYCGPHEEYNKLYPRW